MANPVDLLRIGFNKLEEFFESNMSAFVLYRPRGEERTALIRATPGRNKSDAEETLSVRMEVEIQDFIVNCATPVECQDQEFIDWLGRYPIQNDEITFNNQKYNVTPVPGGEPYEFTEAYRKAIRIHTTAAGETA